MTVSPLATWQFEPLAAVPVSVLAVCYITAVIASHLTGLVLARGAVHDAEHAVYRVAGSLYFLGRPPTW